MRKYYLLVFYFQNCVQKVSYDQSLDDSRQNYHDSEKGTQQPSVVVRINQEQEDTAPVIVSQYLEEIDQTLEDVVEGKYAHREISFIDSCLAKYWRQVAETLR